MAAKKALLTAVSSQGSSFDIDIDIGDEELEKITALLIWMAKDFQSNHDIHVIQYAALEVIAKNACRIQLTAVVAQLSDLIDVMLLDKDGSLKDANETLRFMRRVVKVREQVRADNATERVELNEKAVSLCYQRFGRILITYDLLEHQKKNWKYWLPNNVRTNKKHVKKHNKRLKQIKKHVRTHASLIAMHLALSVNNVAARASSTLTVFP